MNHEKLKEGNRLAAQLKGLDSAKEIYERLITRKPDNRQWVRNEKSDQMEVSPEKSLLPELNEVFHDELMRFLEVMLMRINKEIEKKELEFKNLTAE